MTRARLVTILVLVLLLGWTGWAARSFVQARAALGQASAEAAQAAPSSEGGIAAADERAARALLSHWLGDRAVATAVRVSLVPLTTLPGQIRLKLTAKADEGALRRFIRASEAPGLRSGRWTLASDGSDNLTLKGEITAFWQKEGGSALPPTPVPPAETGRAVFAAGSVRDIAPVAGDVPELVGIAGRLPDDASAILRLAGGATRALARGQSADGWQVTAIAADRVTLTKGSRVHVAILPPTSK